MLTNIALAIALMLSVSAGAFATSRYLINSAKQINPVVIKALRGKSGMTGAVGPAGGAGPQGAQGPQGAPGANGKDGVNGESVSIKKVETTSATCNKLGGSELAVGSTKGTACNGAAGAPGTNGESVKLKSLGTKEGGCEEGGSEFTVGTEKGSACNGSPWTAGGTLPKGATETGEWDFETTAETAGEIKATSISFPIPLATKLAEGNFGVVAANGKPTTGPCAGGEAKHPKAQSGFICLYEVEASLLHKGGMSLFGIFGPEGAAESEQVGVSGGLIGFTAAKPGIVSSEGTWAVTG
jgi:hypothetical protein